MFPFRKKSIKSLSLKWMLFIFYLVFGFFPLIAVSFMTMVAKNQTIEEITKEQMQVSLSQIGLRMDMFYVDARDDLSGFARLIEVPCSINKENLDYKTRLELMILKFLSLHQQFEIVAFCDPNSTVVAVADRKTPFDQTSSMDKKVLVSDFDRKRIIKNFMKSGSRYLPIIYDVRNVQINIPQRDGFILAFIPIKEIAHIFHTANIGKYVEKQIIDFTGQSLWWHNPSVSSGSKNNPVREKKKIQTYITHVSTLGWKLIARIDDAVIFNNIYQQLYSTVAIAFFVFLMAAGFVYEFGRRITRQLQNLLEGTRVFAEGKFDHRVKNIYGKEMTALSIELNKMAQKLERRQSSIIQTNKLESLGLFTAGIAHEIKNPLASIKTSSQVLKNFFLEEDQEKSITFNRDDITDIKTLSNGITDEVNRLNSLLKELLNFSKPSASNKKLVEVKSVIEKSLSFLQSDFSMEKITVEVDVEPFWSWIDSDQLTQIMMNIFLNAKNAFKKKGGLIGISSGRDFNYENEIYRTITINDNGPGIPEELIERIFDPFFSLSRKGTGLGLSIVYILSSQNNIDIEVEGRKEGGTSFILKFPPEIVNKNPKA